jgi:hypothetical protein
VYPILSVLAVSLWATRRRRIELQESAANG